MVDELHRSGRLKLQTASPTTIPGDDVDANSDNPRRPRDAVLPERWSAFYAATHVPAAIRAGGLLHVTGHTGDAADGSFRPRPEEQIRQAFDNLGATLTAAGTDWSAVVEIRTFHVGLREQSGSLLAVAAEFLDPPFPAWTAVGVTELFEPDAIFEISCTARL